jgi:rod shape-determining protein MreB and related proteins
MAEAIKLDIGSAFPLPEEKTHMLRGRNLITGLPTEIEVSSVEIREALANPLNQIIDALKTTIDETPPELVSDLMQYGIALAGGGALLGGIAQRLSQETKMRVYVSEDPLTCVVRGAGHVLEELDTLHKIVTPTRGGRR